MEKEMVSETDNVPPPPRVGYRVRKRNPKGQFKPGWVGGPGRPRGSKGRVPDLSDHLAAARRAAGSRRGVGKVKPLDYFYCQMREKCPEAFLARLTALEKAHAEKVRERYIRKLAEKAPKPDPAPAVESATVPETVPDSPEVVEAMLAEIARKAQE